MPILVIATNVPRSAIPDGFLKEVQTVLQEANLPKEYIAVQVAPDQLMSFGGTEEPCGLVYLTTTVNLGEEENKALSASIFKVLEDKLKITNTRAYIVFTNKPGREIGYMGTLLAQ